MCVMVKKGPKRVMKDGTSDMLVVFVDTCHSIEGGFSVWICFEAISSGLLY
jgi:hypothetical protein